MTTTKIEWCAFKKNQQQRIKKEEEEEAKGPGAAKLEYIKLLRYKERT